MAEFTGERVIPGLVDDNLWAEHFARYAFARRLAKGARVLDAGCGSGYGAAELALDARSVTAVDLSTTTVATARESYPLRNLSFVAGSCTHLPFRPASFDLITAFEVIEHLRDYKSLISECARVLAPGGYFLVSTPNREYYAETREEVGPNLYHEHEFEAQEFLDELRAVFPHVTILLQNRVEAFAFHPSKALWQADVRIDSGGGRESDAHFFFAICSKDAAAAEQAFVYVPKAANLLRERARHVQALKQQVAVARANHDRVLGELEEHNFWAQKLDQELVETREIVVKLDDENLKKTEWARRIEQSLTEQLTKSVAAAEANEARLIADLKACAQALEERQATLDERTQWALSEVAQRQHLERVLAMVQASRWVKLGRRFHIGPEVNKTERP